MNHLLQSWVAYAGPQQTYPRYELVLETERVTFTESRSPGNYVTELCALEALAEGRADAQGVTDAVRRYLGHTVLREAQTIAQNWLRRDAA